MMNYGFMGGGGYGGLLSSVNEIVWLIVGILLIIHSQEYPLACGRDELRCVNNKPSTFRERCWVNNRATANSAVNTAPLAVWLFIVWLWSQVKK